MDELRRELTTRLYRLILRAADGRYTPAHSPFAIASTSGPVREENQDRAVVSEIFGGSGPPMRIAIVCDGLGGMEAGQNAASIATATFLVSLLLAGNGSISSHLREACLRANDAVHGRLRGDGGTTMTAVAITSDGATCIHVGDSRLYVLSEDGDLTLATQDDTLSGAIHAQAGQLDEDALDNRLLQFVGIGSDINPHLVELNITSPAMFMITSDGAHGMGRRVLDGIVSRVRSPGELARKIVTVADALNVSDNATVACLINSRWEQGREGRSVRRLVVHTTSDQIEIWLPDMSGVATPTVERDQDQPSANVKKERSKPAKTSIKKSGAPRRQRPSRPPDEPPMEVIFRIGEGEGSND